MTQPGNRNTLRLATFNMENLGEGTARAEIREERIAVLRPQLLRLRADILCLQEVNGQRKQKSDSRRLIALETLLEKTPYHDYHRVATTGKTPGNVSDKHNLVILSRFPASESHQIHHHLIEPPVYRQATCLPLQDQAQAIEWDRPFLHAAFETGSGRKLHVINLHLRAPRAAFIDGQKIDSRTWRTVPGWAEGYFLAAVKQAGQALEVRLFIDSLLDADPAALIAVAGDFNADDHEIPVRTIRGDEEDIGNGTLSPRVLVALERSLPESVRFSVIHSGSPRMVDHVMASQSLCGWYVETEIHNEALGDELSAPAVIKGTPDSYHAPVVAEFRFGD